MTKTSLAATLTDRDLDEIEAQMDSTVPIYVPTLIRELRETRKALKAALDAHRDTLLVARAASMHAYASANQLDAIVKAGAR